MATPVGLSASLSPHGVCRKGRSHCWPCHHPRRDCLFSPQNTRTRLNRDIPQAHTKTQRHPSPKATHSLHDWSPPVPAGQIALARRLDYN